jgi:hypothetical protein
MIRLKDFSGADRRAIWDAVKFRVDSNIFGQKYRSRRYPRPGCDQKNEVPVRPRAKMIILLWLTWVLVLVAYLVWAH